MVYYDEHGYCSIDQADLVQYVKGILSMFRLFFFFKQKTAYEMRISDWSSDVCSSDLAAPNCAAIYPKCRCWWISARPPPKGEPLPQNSLFARRGRLALAGPTPRRHRAHGSP